MKIHKIRNWWHEDVTIYCCGVWAVRKDNWSYDWRKVTCKNCLRGKKE